MRYLVGTVVFLRAALCLPAGDTGNPNTLTPKEIEDGWVLLFEGKTTFGWKIDGAANIKDGSLVLGGKMATRATLTAPLGNCELRVESSGGGRLVSDAVGFSREKTWQTLLCDVPAGSKALLRGVKVRPLGLKPIFNGKDLSGWKEFPGRKSKFSVTQEGWINIKNGPGDLQTEGQWDDFILQLDCRSNGDRLNSGVFFRCRPNEYQNGYEAQIHNGFTAEPAKEYTLEEYDPTTHKLTGKEKVKYTAIDYGTGAIYRRIPARFQAAKDHEWFTMTVLARGNHIATWVNGIQMVDWTDNRPPNDNARNGCKLGKGPISLQGHDPTTDLSFRNIRIAEFPK